MAQPTFSAPLPLILDLNGNGLNAGKVYIGVAGQDPQSFPQTCYWDAAGTVPASQPIATQAGYFANAGNVAQLFGPTNYSIRVLDSNNALVYYQSTVSNALAGPLALSANGLTVGTTQLVCSGGFVGFGTATPGSAADVAGTLRVTNPSVSTQYYAMSVTAGTFVAAPSAGVTAMKWQADLHVIWNAAGSTQYAAFNSSGFQSYGGIFDSVGNVRQMPRNAQSGNYTLALTDNGGYVDCTNVGVQSVTIPTNATVAFGNGAMVTILNFGGTTAVTVVPIAGTTLTQAGTGATGTRTIAVNGMATILQRTANTWVINGTSVT